MKQFTNILLFPFALIYGLIVYVRDLLYDRKFFRAVSFDVPVITVGNLSTGGTGKTPHVDYLIHLLKVNYPVGVLSRGYRRKTSGFMEVNPTHKAWEVGDEPLLTKWKHPDISVAVGENRALAIPSLLSNKPENFVVILDDGFQHRAVRAGLNILLTPYDDLYVDNLLLPMGNLREFKSGADRADIVIVSHSPKNLDEQSKKAVEAKLNLKKHQKLFFSYLEYLPTYRVFQASLERLIPEKDSELLLLTGIANHTKMLDFLEHSYPKVYTRSFSDHYTYHIQDIESIIATYKDIKGENKYIVTTEKDLTRLVPFADVFNKAAIKVLCLPIKVNFAGVEKIRFDKTINFFVERTLEDYLSV